MRRNWLRMGILFLGMLMSWSVIAQENGILKKGYYPDGKLRYEGYFEGEVPVGKMTRYYPNGQVQAEMMHKGRETEAVLYSKDGTYCSSGHYLDRKKEGEWRYEKEKQLLATETYKDNVLDGVSRKYFSCGGTAEEKHWKNGLPDGDWKMFYRNGKIRLEACFAGGKLEGELRAYSAAGQRMAEGKYRNNLKEGVWHYYDEDGNLRKERIYKAGIANDQEQQDIAASRKLDEWVKEGKKIADPAHFTDEPEMYLKVAGD